MTQPQPEQTPHNVRYSRSEIVYLWLTNGEISRLMKPCRVAFGDHGSRAAAPEGDAQAGMPCPA
jgi:hypothetical protein